MGITTTLHDLAATIFNFQNSITKFCTQKNAKIQLIIPMPHHNRKPILPLSCSLRHPVTIATDHLLNGILSQYHEETCSAEGIQSYRYGNLWRAVATIQEWSLWKHKFSHKKGGRQVWDLTLYGQPV